MILDLIIDSLLLLTNACLKVLLFLQYFFLIWEMPKNMIKTIHETQKFFLAFFTNHLN